MYIFKITILKKNNKGIEKKSISNDLKKGKMLKYLLRNGKRK